MPRRPRAARRWLTAASWPIGVALTSWDYMWRTTVMYRREVAESEAELHMPRPYPNGVDTTEVQSVYDGVGPLFHRRYQACIRGCEVAPEELMRSVKRDLNAVAPTTFARFQRVLGDGDSLTIGDEYVVRMPGPWDGPVRVIEESPEAFRLATLDGHLEAGQIEFRASSVQDGRVRFTIESWARSADRLSNFLYHRARMAKEVQLHMWISFLEGVGKLSRGKIDGGIDIDTRRVDDFAAR
ncbi:MAG TPA: DUF1990 family protein [Solirubrobacteraceae bacterium]|jgi:uncharacterized protein DUF1990|nr:DUF1990 family protein [Solirubrobacteraceae bacterium]